MKITKIQLRQLQSHRGEIDLDSGQRFDGFIGALNIRDGLYHGDVTLSDSGDATGDIQTFSIAATIKPTTKKQAAAIQVKPPISKKELTDGDSEN